MATKSSLRALDQYKTNVQAATTRVTQEDSVLQQISNLLDRLKQLGVAQATDTATAQTRTVANAEVQQIFGQLVALGNTQLGGEYLFGGQKTTTQPFAATGSGATLNYTSTNPTGQRAVAIGDGQTIAATHDGTQVFISSGVLDAAKQPAQSLDSSSPTYGQSGIGNALSSIDSASQAVQTLIGETGANEQQLTTTTQNLTALSTNVTTLQSNLQDVDLEQAMTELTSRQTAYQAAMLAMSKVANLTLTNYLR
jgi:flagellar hook-associated protein 3 FlgL